MKALIFLPLLVLCSCAGLKTKSQVTPKLTSGFYLQFDKNVNEKTRELTIATVKDLNRRMKRDLISLKMKKNQKLVLVSYSSDFENRNQLGKASCDDTACYISLNNMRHFIHTPETAPVFFWQKTEDTQSTLQNLIRHEIGHVMGLEHDPAPGHIMSEYAHTNYSEKEVSLWAKKIKTSQSKGNK